MRKVIAIVSDDHSGHPFALPPSEDGWESADGQWIETNDWQKIIWNHWCESWDRVADYRRGGQLIVVHAGDAVEGVHHGSVQLVTQRIDEQERMHIAAMREGLRRSKWRSKRDRLIYIAGTRTHVGEGNSSTERIVRDLLGVDELDGTEVRQRLLASANGQLFDIAHKGYALGGRSWTRTNSMRAWLESYWEDSLKHKVTMPRYVVRGHRHTYGYSELCDDAGVTVSEAFLMPSWKLVDDYVRSFAAEAVASIGMLVFVVEDNGTTHHYPLLMRCEQDTVEEL